jgi:uncharacterized membrane protein
MDTVWLYLIAVPIFLAIDMIWLVVIASGFYKRQLGELLAARPNWVAAVIFYLLYVLGIVVFASQPADNGWQALGLGALFGLIAYATYDLTNLATIRDWPVTLVVVDLVWGAALSAVVAAAAYSIY